MLSVSRVLEQLAEYAVCALWTAPPASAAAVAVLPSWISWQPQGCSFPGFCGYISLGSSLIF